MIGRTGPVKPFELIRWARAAGREHNLKPLESHVLLLLATYANHEAEAWPSIGTLARDVGLKVRVTETGVKNSAISAALARLAELSLIWRKQAGHGKPARTELLFNPAQPSARTEGYQGQPSTPSPPAARTQPSAVQEAKGQRNGQGLELPNDNYQRPEEALLQAGGLHLSADQEPEEHPAEVRAAIVRSLDLADAARRAA